MQSMLKTQRHVIKLTNVKIQMPVAIQILVVQIPMVLLNAPVTPTGKSITMHQDSLAKIEMNMKKAVTNVKVTPNVATKKRALSVLAPLVTNVLVVLLLTVPMVTVHHTLYVKLLVLMSVDQTQSESKMIKDSCANVLLLVITQIPHKPGQHQLMMNCYVPWRLVDLVKAHVLSIKQLVISHVLPREITFNFHNVLITTNVTKSIQSVLIDVELWVIVIISIKLMNVFASMVLSH